MKILPRISRPLALGRHAAFIVLHWGLLRSVECAAARRAGVNRTAGDRLQSRHPPDLGRELLLLSWAGPYKRWADLRLDVRDAALKAEAFAPGVTVFMTGAQVLGRPSMGAWLSYGLGCASENLPAYVVMTSSDKAKTCGQLYFDHYSGSGFLPSRFQGFRFRNTGDLVPYLANPPGVSGAARGALLDDIAALNQQHLAEYGGPEIDTRSEVFLIE